MPRFWWGARTVWLQVRSQAEPGCPLRGTPKGRVRFRAGGSPIVWTCSDCMDARRPRTPSGRRIPCPVAPRGETAMRRGPLHVGPSRTESRPAVQTREQGPSDAEAKRAGLSRQSSAVHTRAHVKGSQRVRCREAVLDVLNQRAPWEIITQGPAIDVPLTGARREIDSGDAGLTSS